MCSLPGLVAFTSNEKHNVFSARLESLMEKDDKVGFVISTTCLRWHGGRFPAMSQSNLEAIPLRFESQRLDACSESQQDSSSAAPRVCPLSGFQSPTTSVLSLKGLPIIWFSVSHHFSLKSQGSTHYLVFSLPPRLKSQRSTHYLVFSLPPLQS
ncbi:hypothetical protein RRG08_014596 [Elysia crispata]|uniref:Uncharacterized protein n=1 Tax=Elysia crispata TaxID=231223 RepID=A0AAE0Z2E5_9GAST|nr:hypothetical protein RRG08_014596 [Elysia crispata]